MRHRTLVEQMATYASGVFTLSDAIAGRRDWNAGGVSFRAYYRAANADETEWEVGIADSDGGTSVTRVSVSLSSSGGSAVEFTGPVKLSLIGPAGALWAVDGASFIEASADAVGTAAMAAGLEAEAYGTHAIALGFSAEAGQDFAPVEGALALGGYASSRHFHAVALGYDSTTLIREAIHHRGAFWWSKRGSVATIGLESVFISSNDSGSEPEIAEGKVLTLKALVVAQNTAVNRFYAAEISAMVRRPVGGVAAVLGTPTVTEIHKTGGVAVSATIAGTGSGGRFGIEVTGESGHDWLWCGELRGVWL